MSQLAKNRYPRSIPFQAPPANPRPPSTIHCPPFTSHRAYVIALVAGALLIAGVAGGFVFANRGPAPTPADAMTASNNERMLETLGSLSAAHLYQSYLNIGLLADAVEKESYSPEQANNMLATVVSLMNVVDKQLDKLGQGALGEEEKKDVERIRQLSGLLRVQVSALRAFWLTGDTQQARRFEEAREQAWTALSEVLGL